MQRNTVIRDAMRETCLLDLAQFWLHIIVSATNVFCLHFVYRFLLYFLITK